MQHIVHDPAPGGIAGFVPTDGLMPSADHGMVVLPGQLFHPTRIPACPWFFARERGGGGLHGRRGSIPFIDIRKPGTMLDRIHSKLADEDIARVADVRRAWRGEEGTGGHTDVQGFGKDMALEAVRKHGLVPTRSRHVGAEAPEDDGEPFADEMKRPAAQLRERRAGGAQFNSANLEALGSGAGR